MSEETITVIISGKEHRKELLRYGSEDCILVSKAYLPVRKIGKFWYLVASLEMDKNIERRHNP